MQNPFLKNIMGDLYQDEQNPMSNIPTAQTMQPSPVAAQPLNPVVVEYLKPKLKKPEEQGSVVASEITAEPPKEDSNGFGFDWQAGIAGLGQAIAGRDPSSIIKAIKDRRIVEEERAGDSNPTSEQSIMAQQLASKLMPGKDFSKASAAQLKKVMPGLESLAKLQSDELNRAESRAERRSLAEIARGDRLEAREQKKEEQQQALQTPYGLANTVDDAKQLKAADEAKKNFDNKLNQLIDIRKNAGGGQLLDRDTVGRSKQLSKDLLLAYKDMAKLGVLSQSDEAILNEIIPADPTEFRSPLAVVTGSDPILTKLEGFKKDSDSDFSNRVATRTREGMSKLQQGESSPSSETKTINGVQYIKVPGGWKKVK